MKRSGFVLPAVLFALVLLAALSASGFFASLQESRTGRNAVLLARSDAAAARAIVGTMSAWDAPALDGLPTGGRVAMSPALLGGLAVQADVQRLSPRLFAIHARADAGTDAGRALTAIVRLRGLDLDPPAAVRARTIDPSLTPFIDGVDRAPAGWTCPQPRDTVTASLAQPGASDSVFLRFGDRDWASLTGWVSAGLSGVDSVFARYEPGSFALDGTRFVGLLVVEGDLVLRNGAALTGLAIVRGRLTLAGPVQPVVAGAVVAGELVAAIGLTPTRPVVSYSSCAVLAASLSHARPEPVQGQPLVGLP